jgi:hypothetical protein
MPSTTSSGPKGLTVLNTEEALADLPRATFPIEYSSEMKKRGKDDTVLGDTFTNSELLVSY